MPELVEVGRYMSKVEADLACARLAASGIETFVDDPPYPVFLMPSEGVRLRVASRDEDRARSILQELEESQRTHQDFEDDADPAVVRCPRCELDYCYFQRPVMRGVSAGAAGLPVALATVFLWFMPKRWTCHKCGYVWDDPKEGPKRITPLPAGMKKPVFRLPRANPGLGFVMGFVPGLFLFGAMGGLSSPLGLLALALPAGGWFLGTRYVRHYCSEPSCRARLRSSDKVCPGCKGKIAGVVDSAAEHYAAAADYRRSVQGRKRKKKRPAPQDETPT